MIQERIKEVMNAAGLTMEQFAARLGENNVQRLKDVFRGKQRPPAEMLVAIVSEFRVDGTWLLTGSDPGKLAPREAALLDNYRHTDEQGRRVVEAAASEAAKPKKGKKVG